ncbi:EamA family transporter [Limnohabitans sp. Jir61]|uniref:DMT family transporter n=1 Tax=Limnohabitans sp. Jir61 TaxID=1826168 RepID=UPI000D337FE4|nr:DMT family transporter [Limnohabitans sp. Jir61]PUE32328.1 EamA family transporter [Limnohabitans sp. Jir61]
MSMHFSSVRAAFLTLVTMLAFAGNSVLCRMALKHTTIDAATFTSIRLVSGAVVLWLIARFARAGRTGAGNWWSALALFVYAAGFSLAYVSLSAATGALLLFGSVQATMIGRGIWQGERLARLQWLGLVLALAGLVGLMLPGLAAPPLLGAALMVLAGAAWGVYSLRGKGAGDPTLVTAGNFWRAAVLALVLSAVMQASALLNASWDAEGLAYAVASGAVTSGLGYALWYSVLPALKATQAATIQLSVPVLAALGGVALLGEVMNEQFVLASVATLGGIALVIWGKRTS